MQNKSALAQLKTLIERVQPEVEGRIAETALEVAALAAVMNVSNDLGFQATFIKPGEGVRLLAFGRTWYGLKLVEVLIPAVKTMINRLDEKRKAELDPTWSLGRPSNTSGKGRCGPIRFETKCVFPEMWAFRVTDNKGAVLDQGTRKTADGAAAACEGIARNKALLAREAAERKAKDAIVEGKRIHDRLVDARGVGAWIVVPNFRM